MAGQEVTFDDVARAAESLQEDGEAVTIEAVQDFLGEGSPNAIFKHLAAWRAANVKPKATPKAELPQELLAGLADWALKFAEESGAGDREALARNEADIEALRAAGEALEGERDALREEVASVTAASEEAIAERDETIERLNAELKNARQVAMDALVSKAKDQLAIDGKEQQLTQLRQELERKVADMAAESDARLRAEMELVGATTARDSLAAELDDLRAKLDKSTAERSKLRAELTELKSKK
ncbi:replication region DNA-binding N-term [Massilia sp. PDC64]|nr:DNA-binding protein [Massilia sp. PDC64]SDD37973.1 replication region DNA-binding N-term [Massilia sp. PDC64]